MRKITVPVWWYLIMCFGLVAPLGCDILRSTPVQSALQKLAPKAVEALGNAVVKRWGEEAQVHEGSAGCFPAEDAVADSFGDDDRDFVYIVCRAKAE